MGHDVARLVRYASTEEVEPGAEASLRSVLVRSAARLADARVRIEEALESLGSGATAGLRSVGPHLVASAVVAAAGGRSDLGSGARVRWVRALAQLASRVRSSITRRLVSAWYRRSRGVILGERLRAGERAGRTPVDRLLGLVESVSPVPEVLSELPFYYRQLFLERGAATRDFWVSRPREEGQVDVAFDRFGRGHEGGLLVVGDPGSGRSSFVAHVAQKHGASALLRVRPPRRATGDPSTFEEHLRSALGGDDEAEATLAQLPVGTVIVIDDVDLWWERRRGGLGVIERILSLIDRFGGRCFFIVASTTVTERLLNRLLRLEERFLASVHLEPFSAESLRDIVLVRHRATGMSLTVDGAPTQGLADWRLARFFNQLFDRTHGNVGEALQGWIASITSLSGDEVHVATGEAPRLRPLRELSARQRALLGALMVHRRTSPESVRGAMGLDPAELVEEIAALRRSGLVEETRGTLVPSRYVEPYLRRDLQARGVL
jgi:hypothetical protein